MKKILEKVKLDNIVEISNLFIKDNNPNKINLLIGSVDYKFKCIKEQKTQEVNYKYLPTYFVAFAIFVGFVYVIIPKFYSYDKSKIEKIVCNKQNIECLVKGKIYYNFLLLHYGIN